MIQSPEDSVQTADPRTSAGDPRTSAGDPRIAIRVRGLSKSFGRGGSGKRQGEQALKGIDLDVVAGEFLVLLGPSGCGKTTLLRSIAGLEQPDGGSISIDGTPVFDVDARVDIEAERRPVSMIFQSYALWPHMTAKQNVAFPLECRGTDRRHIPARVSEVLDKVGIGHLEQRYPGEMSGGQQQRLALARALVVGQRVVLFDEPLSNVDAQVRERLRLELLRMQRELGFTAIYVTHDQSEAMELADRIAVMEHGRIAQLGAPFDMYARPRNVHVARFLGQSNEIPLEASSFDPSSGLVAGTSPFGDVTARWHTDPDEPSPQAGDELIAFGRPTDFEVRSASAIEASGLTSDVWRGRIQAVRFLGTHTEHIVTVGGRRIRCWTSAPPNGLAEGDEVIVSIPATSLQALRAVPAVDRDRVN